MKTIQAIYRAGYTSYDGLDTYSALSGPDLPMGVLDPFLFLNHHGPQTFAPNNAGLPFGPHPHKGFETVTFIVEGDLVHRDSTGFASNIRAGGIQWMTAGRGIIHSETSSDAFLKNGGRVELLQLWVNLPSQLKTVAPNYTGLQKEQVPQLAVDNALVTLNLVSGVWLGQQAPVPSLSGADLCTVAFKEKGRLEVSVPANRSVLFYVIRGHLQVNGRGAETHDLVLFGDEGEAIEVTAADDALLLLGHARPTGEPIVAQGPFVMNTQEEIRQAFADYRQGRFGVWPHGQ